MAETPGVNAFRDEDQFLRRIACPDHVKRLLLAWRAFKDRDPRLSFTLRDASLVTHDSLDEYRRYIADKYLGGTLPGICWLSFRGLVRELDPPLPPGHDPDPSDSVYGHLHCSTDSPKDKPHMEKMAKLVNDGEFGKLLCAPEPPLGGEPR